MVGWIWVVLAACDNGVEAEEPPAEPVVDGTDLDAVAAYYFDLGEEERTPKWEWLAAESQDGITQEDYESGAFWPSQKVEVLRHDNVGGASFGVVSVSSVRDRDDGRCSMVDTYSFVSEDGTWRLLQPYRQMEAVGRLTQSGDYNAAFTAAKAVLEIDPFNVSAYQSMVFADARSGASRDAGEYNLDDALRAVANINPSDHNGLFLATSYTRDIDVSRAMLERIPADSCVRQSALSNLVLKLRDKKRWTEALELLDGEEGVSPTMHRVVLLHLKGSRKEALAELRERGEAIRSMLGEADPLYAAHWAGSMAEVALAASDRALAKEWVSYGLQRDPTSSALAGLLRKLK